MGNHVASVLYDMGEQLELGEIQRHTDWAEVPIAALLASSEKVEGEKCQGFHVLCFGGVDLFLLELMHGCLDALWQKMSG